jgi:hypothetical protein
MASTPWPPAPAATGLPPGRVAISGGEEIRADIELAGYVV